MLAGLLTRKIKEEAIALGFDRVGIAPVEAVPDDKLLSWLRLEYQGEMRYMARQIEKRLDPNRILPGAKSVVSVALNYYHDYGLAYEDAAAGVISRYASGDDYHQVLGTKLTRIMQEP